MFLVWLVVGYIACSLVSRPTFDRMYQELVRLRKENKNLQERIDAFQDFLDKSGL